MVIFPLAPDQTIAQMWSNGARGGPKAWNTLPLNVHHTNNTQTFKRVLYIMQTLNVPRYTLLQRIVSYSIPTPLLPSQTDISCCFLNCICVPVHCIVFYCICSCHSYAVKTQGYCQVLLISSALYAIARPSVCAQCVTRVCHIKTIEIRIMIFSPSFQFLRGKFHPEILRGSPSGVKHGGVGKQAIFYRFKCQYLVNGRRYVQILLLMTNRKSHIFFRLMPRPMTSDDLDLL